MKIASKKLYQRILNMGFAFVLALSSVSASVPYMFAQTANAIGGIDISTVAELRDAIENQADGQTWTIEPGTYGLTPFNTISAGGQTGWYLPITADNLTINGVGHPILYGTGFTANGNWSTQNFVSVFGDNVTINGLTLMPKVEPNKTIEVLGSDFTLKNTVIEPNTLTDQSEYDSISDVDWSQEAKEWGGSLYFSHEGNHVVKNVTIKNAGISYRYAPSDTHIKFQNVKLDYSTNVDWINGYRYSSGFNNSGNSVTGAPKVTYHVSESLNNLESVLSKVQDGDNIVLNSNITLTKQLTLNKAVTLNGKGHKLLPTFTKSSNSNNSALSIQSDNVSVKNLVVKGENGTNLHGINIYQSANVELNNVTSKDNDYSGVNVNGSTVTVNNITTANNGWHGIDVDKTGAVLTINGTSHHSDVIPVYVDAVGVGQVVDTNNQYGSKDNVLVAGDRVYGLKPGVPTLQYPANNGYVTTNDFWFDWSDVSDAAQYEVQYSQNPAVGSDGAFQNVVWTGDYQHNQPTESKAHSVGANGTWYWQVRTINAIGIKSGWSPVWKMTIDMVAPAAPVLTSPADGTVTKGASITQSWSDTSSDVDHYVYESYNDSGATSLRWHQEYSSTSKTATHVAESTYWWRVKAVDYAGNASGWSPLWKITVDNTAPTATIDSAAPKAYYNGATNISVHAIDANYAKTELYHNSDATPFKTYTGSYFGLFWLADGHYRMDVIDQAGNVTEYTFTIDKTRPDVSFVTPTDFSTPFSLLSQIAISATDSTSGISGTPVVHVYHSNGTPAIFCNGTACDTSGLADGDYYVKAGANDNAGNNKTVTEYFTVDSTAPVVDITAPSDGDLVHGVVTISGTVTDANPDHYYLVVKDSSNHVVAGPHTVHAANVTDYNWDTTGVADGTYTIDLEARDAANNKDSNSVKIISVVVDNTSPVVAYIDSAKIGNVITPNFTATDTNGPLVYSWVANDADSAANVVISDPTALNPDFTANVDGSYSFTLIATDTVGNTSVPQTFSFTYTTPAPTPTPTSSPTVTTASTQSNGGTTGFTNVTSNNNDSDADVLGTETQKSDNKSNSNSDKNVLGTSTKNNDGVWNILGFAWYWWVLILAAIAAIARWLYGRFNQANA